ncbi:UDP-N-acetylmuramate--alanine ligase [Wolbachia endosymbiont of Bemisia tabaci]|nr:Mur ligase domain-containing protein [Wolbachia endosymbiont of Bemisia tabaci]AZU37098.1 UDP-N-acetylmuramate--alanine ligase [Wolbachia endosymbiont of Bemisia tabaci]AZU37131.1 UDP-N-acetylmuramate--alanine ligase [Wolbachia endosymbiont of Bemisia tabaci]
MRILNYTIINLVISKRLLPNMHSTKKEVIHIIGIGGIGMSAIAEILHNSSYKVQGSDTRSNDNIDRLQKLGIEVYIGHDASSIRQAQIVVHSSAIKPDNVELVAARNNNKTVLHRSDMLVKIMKGKYVIAVSGSSGKTTTTAMIASIFDHSGADATVIVGGILNSYQSNSKLGKSDIFLIEADESDGTMLKIPADIAVVTSINDDHIDHYGTFNEIKNAFSRFVNNANFAILPDSADINHDASNSITFGFGNGKIRASNIKQHNNSIEFDVLISINESNRIPLSTTRVVERDGIKAALSSSPQCLKLDSRFNVKQDTIEFKRTIPRKSLHSKKVNRTNAI